MAQRRMFSKRITDTDLFTDMPLSTQALYFHLNMNADDDGFISNVKRIKSMIGASDDDLKLLFAKQFLIPFENGIVVIKDWRIHNYIQKDRYQETLYKTEKAMLSSDKNGSYELCTRNVSKTDTQVRLGKDRLEIGKDKETLSDKSDSVPFKEIIDYLNQKTDKNFRNVESNKKPIRARFNEGATLDNFKRVIDIKTAEWIKSDMAKYLQPSTLFGNKFDQYLNQKQKKQVRASKSYGGVEF